MKRLWIALAVPAAIVAVLAVARTTSRPTHERSKAAPRMRMTVVETDPAAPVVAPTSESAPRKIESKPDTPLPVPEESKALALLRKIDWKRMGDQQLAVEDGKKEWDAKDTAGQMKSMAAWMELMAYLMEHPEEKERLGREISLLSTEGYLAALGIALADDQQARLRAFFETQPLDLSSLDWLEADKKDYDILRAMEKGLAQEIATDRTLAGILTGPQQETYGARRPQDPSSVGFWKDEIEAKTPQEAAEKVAVDWMESLKIPEEGRSAVLAAAQSYYATFQSLHQGYEHADRNRRAEIWISTVQALQKVRDDLKDLIPEEGRDGMAWMQIPTFSK